jgi:hypothetical protein
VDCSERITPVSAHEFSVIAALCGGAVLNAQRAAAPRPAAVTASFSKDPVLGQGLFDANRALTNSTYPNLFNSSPAHDYFSLRRAIRAMASEAAISSKRDRCAGRRIQTSNRRSGFGELLGIATAAAENSCSAGGESLSKKHTQAAQRVEPQCGPTRNYRWPCLPRPGASMSPGPRLP